MRVSTWLCLLALVGQAATAQLPAMADPSDPHARMIVYRAGQVVRLASAPGYQLTVALAPDEQVQTVAVGDSGAWQVAASKDGSHVFVKPTVAGASSDMTVITNVRRYTFELEALSAPSPDQAYTVRFDYPSPAPAAAMPQGVEGRYKLHGARALMPSRISDDGRRTFVEWPRDVDLPAVYGVNAQGREALVNGMFRGDRLVIDSVVERLVFRIDDRVAHAVRRSRTRTPR